LKESIQKLAEVLKKGKNIVIFPEGTRTKTGKPGEFKKTFAILSTELNIPVVPVAINGAYKAMSRRDIFLIPFSQIRVTFYQPIYPDGYTSDELTSIVQEKIHKMVSE